MSERASEYCLVYSVRLQVQQQRKRTPGSPGTLALGLWSLVGRDTEDRRVENVDLEGRNTRSFSILFDCSTLKSFQGSTRKAEEGRQVYYTINLPPCGKASRLGLAPRQTGEKAICGVLDCNAPLC